MLTYEDLEKCGDDETKTRDFIYTMIAQQNDNPRFQEGLVAGEFYRGGDPEIRRFEHIIYDTMGFPRKDEFRANHKLTTNLYNLFITQEISYLLGNGISFENEKIKEQFGTEFDYNLQDLATWAANDSEAYAYLTKDGIEIFNVACDDEEPHFIPIFSLTDRKQPKAGIRHWRAGEFQPLNVILYRASGYSVWQEKDGKLQITQPEKPYDITYTENEMGERWDIETNRKSELPIIPLFYINHKSAIHNQREKLNAYNLVLSGLVNNTTEVNLLYWVIKNADGMDDTNYENFITNLYKSHVLSLPDGVEADPHEIKTDFDGYQSTLSRLRAELFQDFKAVDTMNIAGGNKTTVEIKAAYENLNLKCDDLEKQIGKFIRKVLKFYGFDENSKFHFTRPMNVNMTEFITMLNSSVNNTVNEEDAMKLAYSVLGMIDEYDEAVKKRQADELRMMTDLKNNQTPIQEENQ